MADVAACRAALDALGAQLAGLTPEQRAKHVPRRTVLATIKDLDVRFVGRLDEDGLHDVTEVPAGDHPESDVQVSVASDDLLALARGEESFVTAWLRGRVTVSAGVRDLLRLRSLLGL